RPARSRRRRPHRLGQPDHHSLRVGRRSMIFFIFYAVLAGLLVGLSRQLNGRLALSTTPLIASFWNHLVGFALLTALGLVIGGLFTPGALDTPWWAYLG